MFFMSKSYKNIGCENLYLRYFNHKDTKYLLLVHHLDVAPNESKSTLDIFWKLKVENLVLSTNTILGNYICKKVSCFLMTMPQCVAGPRVFLHIKKFHDRFRK